MHDGDLVRGSARLIAALGRWPRFHDAVVVGSDHGDTRLCVRVHVFTMTDAVDARGVFVLKAHHLVEIVMTGVRSSTLAPGYAGDVLDHLALARDDGMIRVSFVSHMDRGGDVTCEQVSIGAIVPCDANGMPVKEGG